VRVQLRRGRGRVAGRLAGLLVVELELAGGVARVDVDLAGLDRGRDDLTGPEVELVGDRVAVVSERLAVDLSQDAALREVEPGDD